MTAVPAPARANVTSPARAATTARAATANVSDAPRPVPGPKTNPWIQTLRYLLDPEGYLRMLHARYGDVILIHTVVFGPEIAVVRPDAIRFVFTGDPEELRAGEANTALEPVLGPRSVLLLDGAEHLRQRRLLLPPFHGERMLAYA